MIDKPRPISAKITIAAWRDKGASKRTHSIVVREHILLYHRRLERQRGKVQGRERDGKGEKKRRREGERGGVGRW